MKNRYVTKAEIEAQNDGYAAGLEAAAEIATSWPAFVKTQCLAGECGEDEYNINNAAALTIARKIREQIFPANEQA